MKNKRYVLTGGPGSGKSSILIALELQGFQVIREAAEDYIKYRQAQGVERPWKEENFQEQIFWLQYGRESKQFNDFVPVFIDRGLHDGLAYARGEFKKKLEKYVLGEKYTKVFLIEHSGSIEQNHVRREDIENALELEKNFEKTYKKYNYEIVRIPFMGLDKRVEVILKEI